MSYERFTAKIGRTPFDISITRGTVTEVRKWDTTHVTTSGGGYIQKNQMLHALPTYVHYHNVSNEQIWFRTESGQDTDITLTNCDFRCRAGHQISVVKGSATHNKNEYVLLAFNHTMGTSVIPRGGVATAASKSFGRSGKIICPMAGIALVMYYNDLIFSKGISLDEWALGAVAASFAATVAFYFGVYGPVKWLRTTLRKRALRKYLEKELGPYLSCLPSVEKKLKERAGFTSAPLAPAR